MKKYSLWVLLTLISSGLWAQAPPSISPQYIPPSPNAASLGSFGNIPVGLYTGTPTVNIPLHTIQYKDLRLPMSLTYQGTGVRVGQEAPWVGLGWTLNAGGVITRTVRAADDFNSGDGGAGNGGTQVAGYPFLLGMPTLGDFSTANPNAPQLLQQDLESDLYYFHVGDLSGKFVLNINQGGSPEWQVTLLSPAKTHVVYQRQTQQWEITAEDGTKYIFKTREYTYSKSGSGITFSAADDNCDLDNPYDRYFSTVQNPIKELYDAQEHISAWYLDKIISATGAEITLEYDPANYATKSAKVRSQKYGFLSSVTTDPPNTPLSDYFLESFGGNANFRMKINSSQQVVNDRMLTKIRFGQGEVAFQTEGRLDMEAESAARLGASSVKSPQRLRQIQITHPGSGFQKAFTFDYGYLGTSLAAGPQALRLKLMGLTENGEKAHRFEYDESQALPPKSSLSRDHWGFWNGQNNTGLIPTLTYQAGNQSQLFEVYNGANRETDGTYAQAGTLTKLTYPTGGHTAFEYEPHTYHVDLSTGQGAGENVWVREGLIEQSIQMSTPSTDYYDRSFTLAQNARVGVGRTVTAASNLWLRDVLFGVKNQYDAQPRYYLQILNGDGQLVQQFNIIQDMATYFSAQSPVCPDATQPGCWTASAATLPPVYSQELPAGNYWLRLSKEALTEALPLSFRASVSIVKTLFPPSTQDFTKTGGGIRLKRQSDFDGQNHSSIHRYRYDHRMADNTVRSSGLSMDSERRYGYPLQGIYPKFTVTGTGIGSNTTTMAGVIVNGYVFRSAPNLPLSTSAQGYPVGYSKVTVTNGDQAEEGQVAYEFENKADSPQLPPFVVDFPSDYLNSNNGVILKEEYFKNAGPVQQRVKVVQRQYAELSQAVIPYMKYELQECMSLDPNGCNTPLMTPKSYQTHVVWKYLREERETTYDDDQGAFSTVTSYYHDNPAHYQLTRVERERSDGRLLVTATTYPHDYPGGAAFLDNMKAANVVALPIEQVTYLTDFNYANPRVIAGELTTYKPDCAVCKDEAFLLEAAAPLPFDQSPVGFKFSHKARGILPFDGLAPSTAFQKDARYIARISYQQYHPLTRRLERFSADGLATALTWDATGTFVSSVIRNPDGPSPSQVESYAIDPLLGITEHTTPSGLKNSYEYDAQGRLQRVRNNQGQVVKSYQYHYQN